MISCKTTVFEIDNEKYQFNCLSFNQCINQYAKKNNMKKGKVENLLADKLFVSSSAIHNWRFGSNGPASIDLIKNAAKYLKADYMTLLRKNKEIKEMEKEFTMPLLISWMISTRQMGLQAHYGMSFKEKVLNTQKTISMIMHKTKLKKYRRYF